MARVYKFKKKINNSNNNNPEATSEFWAPMDDRKHVPHWGHTDLGSTLQNLFATWLPGFEPRWWFLRVMKKFPILLNTSSGCKYEGWNFNNGNYLFTTDTKQIHVSKFYCPSV